ncbi:hypothetical protein CC78DRAFT_164439 [Lojkania enalia]|uniref:Uncharacterized protein n=1 Tax=Lojkania enalia TaxID=147567 RepID=A0A9P4KB76_9PLEO|nr:hypothetical protein CC78DRAFT_164439 [Didymosphaeria enalia]
MNERMGTQNPLQAEPNTRGTPYTTYSFMSYKELLSGYYYKIHTKSAYSGHSSIHTGAVWSILEKSYCPACRLIALYLSASDTPITLSRDVHPKRIDQTLEKRAETTPDKGEKNRSYRSDSLRPHPQCYEIKICWCSMKMYLFVAMLLWAPLYLLDYLAFQMGK